jgi:hypothetical protein
MACLSSAIPFTIAGSPRAKALDLKPKQIEARHASRRPGNKFFAYRATPNIRIANRKLVEFGTAKMMIFHLDP